MLRSHVLDRPELVDSRVVHQHIELAVRLFRLGEEPLDVGLLADVGLHGDGFAALGPDVGDHLVRALFAAGVIDHYLRALGGEMLRDRRPDAFGCAGDDGDLAV